ncbi:chitinase-like protein 1, partial [Quercus suber]
LGWKLEVNEYGALHISELVVRRYKVATKEPLTWGLCDNKERDSNSHYCDKNFKRTFPCAPGAAYYGREQNATLAFQIAIWRWMTLIKEHQPLTHDNDTLTKRVSDFGATMNVLYGDRVCGQGDNEFMNNIISHYLYYLDLMGVDRDEVGPYEVLSCAKQYIWSVSLTILLAFTLVLLVNCDYEYSSLNKGLPLKSCYQCNTLKPPPGATGASLACNCNKGSTTPYNRGRPACCKGAVRYYFKMDQFENIFSNRNSLEVETHANKGFLDYQSFITASALYQPYGFGTTYMNWTFFGTKEVAAFLAHVATKISCENYNYGEAGKDLKVDLLNHPEYIEQNATLAFQVAIWRWMMPIKKHQPSAHDVFLGTWKPTKNDTLAMRVSGFGTTMNVLYGDLVCGHGDNESMNNIISHYLYYLDLMGVGREEAGPQEVLSCAKQVAFNPSFSSPP